MRIALVNQPWSRFRPPVDRADSIAIWSYQTARRFVASGQGSVTFLSRNDAGQPSFEVRDGLTFRRLPYWPKRRGYTWLRRGLDALGWQDVPFDHDAFHRGFAAWAGTWARRDGAEVVHVHNFSQFVPIVRRVLPEARIVLHMHCSWLAQLPAALIEPRIAQADGIWGCSAHVVNPVVARFPRHGTRCRVVPNGVDVAAFAPSPRRPSAGQSILFVGRLSPEKGVHTLVEAFTRVAQVLPRATLKLVGPHAPTPLDFLAKLDEAPEVRALGRFYEPGNDDYLGALTRLVPSALKTRVTFAGEVPPARLPRIYAESDVLVNPSLSESFGMSLVEAMAAEVPVVATKVGGMPEIVSDGGTGRLVPADDPRALADALIETLREPARVRPWVRAAAAHVRHAYDWSHVTRQVTRAYRELVG